MRLSLGRRQVRVEPLRVAVVEVREPEQPALARVHDAGNRADQLERPVGHQLLHVAGVALADQGDGVAVVVAERDAQDRPRRREPGRHVVGIARRLHAVRLFGRRRARACPARCAAADRMPASSAATSSGRRQRRRGGGWRACFDATRRLREPGRRYARVGEKAQLWSRGRQELRRSSPAARGRGRPRPDAVRPPSAAASSPGAAALADADEHEVAEPPPAQHLRLGEHGDRVAAEASNHRRASPPGRARTPLPTRRRRSPAARRPAPGTPRTPGRTRRS